jgi:hypothetical protein
MGYGLSRVSRAVYHAFVDTSQKYRDVTNMPCSTPLFSFPAGLLPPCQQHPAFVIECYLIGYGAGQMTAKTIFCASFR